MDSANRMDEVARLVDYLGETKHLPHDEQIKGLYARWPDVTPQEYVTALKLHPQARTRRAEAEAGEAQAAANPGAPQEQVRLYDQGHLHGRVLEKGGWRLARQGKLEPMNMMDKYKDDK